MNVAGGSSVETVSGLSITELPRKKGRLSNCTQREIDTRSGEKMPMQHTFMPRQPHVTAEMGGRPRDLAVSAFEKKISPGPNQPPPSLPTSRKDCISIEEISSPSYPSDF